MIEEGVRFLGNRDIVRGYLVCGCWESKLDFVRVVSIFLIVVIFKDICKYLFRFVISFYDIR